MHFYESYYLEGMVNFDIINALGQKTEQIQNLVLFWDWGNKPKSAISGNLSKMAMFEQLNDQPLLNSKYSLTPQ